MKQLFTHTLALLLVLALAASEASAQQFSKRKQYNSVGLTLNGMAYFGDITPKPSIPSFRAGATRPNVGLSITRRFAPRISGRASLSYGRITGDDAKAADQNDADAKYRYNRNMNFRNDILELSATGIFDLIENRNNYIKRPDFVPYVFGGIGVIRHNPKAEDASGNIVALQGLRTEGQSKSYSLAQFVIPFGAGARYKLNKSFDIGIELGFRKTFTDYLDDVSGNYVANRNDLQSDAAKYFGWDITGGAGAGNIGYPGTYTELNQAGGQRGKSNEKDWYSTLGISVNYILAPRVRNPKFR